jgi:hypothetical protein
MTSIVPPRKIQPFQHSTPFQPQAGFRKFPQTPLCPLDEMGAVRAVTHVVRDQHSVFSMLQKAGFMEKLAKFSLTLAKQCNIHSDARYMAWHC